jgi:hypothetical protein
MSIIGSTISSTAPGAARAELAKAQADVKRKSRRETGSGAFKELLIAVRQKTAKLNLKVKKVKRFLSPKAECALAPFKI